jgi:hypothetical protein
MHPEILRALERERRTELLRHHHYRQSPTRDPVGRYRQPNRRLRRSIGTAFVEIGTRLLGEGRTGVDLVETRS